MKLALKLAQKGRGKTSPNPMVGAVIVKNGRIVGQGFHQKAGEPHAEIIALQKAKGKTKGATLYVNLEPCCHQGRTPPCTSAIIKAKIKRLACAMIDPNPLVNGKGINTLRQAGIEVKIGILEKEARDLNEVYLKFIQKHLPFVTLKAGMTLDGKIATNAGESKWITSEESRKFAHKLRFENEVVMVGVNTIINDDPELTVRWQKEKKTQPIRFILDSHLRIPLKAKVISDKKARTIIATSKKVSLKKIKYLEDQGIEVWRIELDETGKVSLKKIVCRMGKENFTSLLIEGGAEVNAAALKARLVDKIYLFIAPKILGGEHLSVVGDLGIKSLRTCIKLSNLKVKKLGEDFFLTGYL
ncbi:MAG: bifunctional diaminohydroxyphosphoribosylaminopyrimidine deaminase/5-amino-6-(5-phosphoribosylamino)uracil reductase RibD [Candidatus Edwardsbacteria bacterium]